MNNKTILLTATILGVLAIILGAFGAHALKKVLTIEQLNSFETGVKYQMYHAFFLFFLGIINRITQKRKKTIYILTLVGIIFFSGSIYLLATKEITSIDISSIAFITPIGGLLLISAWLVMFLGIYDERL